MTALLVSEHLVISASADDTDGYRVPPVHLLGGECVHDTVGPDSERLIDVQPNRQRAQRIHHDGRLPHNSLERIGENSCRGGHGPYAG